MIRSRTFQSIFLIACILFCGLFVFYHSFIFTSIDQIFAKQDTSKIIELSENIEKKEALFRTSTRMLHRTRSTQRIFATITGDVRDFEILKHLKSTLAFWYNNHKNEKYLFAIYADRNGIPLVAVDFLSGKISNNSETNLVENAAVSLSNETSADYIDPAALKYWPSNSEIKVGNYVVFADHGEQTLRTVFPILDRRSGSLNGYFAIDRHPTSILEWIGSEHESLVIVDEENQVVLPNTPHTDETPHFLTTHLSSLSSVGFNDEKNDVPAYGKTTIGGKEVIITKVALSSIGWNILHTTILDSYVDAPKVRSKILVAGSIIFIMIAGGSIYTLTRRVQSRSEQLEKANEIVSAHSTMLEQELQTAHEMQMRLMPQANPSVSGYEVVGRCRPATEVGGDFFQYFSLGDDKWTFALADVTGHGMQAAVPTMVFSGLLDTEISYSAVTQSDGRVAAAPEQLMGKLNSRLCRFLEPRTFVCLALGELDCAENKMRISNGGCPYPYIYKAKEDAVRELNLSALPLGLRTNSTYEVTEVSINSGDVVVFCSDGIIEAGSKSGELFGFERVTEMIQRVGRENISAEQIIELVFHELDHFAADYEQDDDQTIVVIKAA